MKVMWMKLLVLMVVALFDRDAAVGKIVMNLMV